jgi:hypothetical protein
MWGVEIAGSMDDPLSRGILARTRAHRGIFSVLAIALLGACTTTGAVSSVPPSNEDASLSAVADAAAKDVSTVDPLAEASQEGNSSPLNEASNDDFDPFGPYNRATPGRPDAKADISAPPSPGDAGDERALDAGTADAGAAAEDADHADGAAEVGGGCTTTECVFASQPASCAACGIDLDFGACFAPAINGDVTVLCEGIPDITPGRSEVQFCIQALQQIIASGCAADGQLTPCLCGNANPVACQTGAVEPTGPLYNLYADDLSANNRNITDIVNNFANRIYGVGAANEMIQCLGAYGCTDCLKAGAPDGGAE